MNENNNGLGNINNGNNPINPNTTSEVPTTPERPYIEVLTPSSPDVLDAFRIGDSVFEVPVNPAIIESNTNEVQPTVEVPAEVQNVVPSQTETISFEQPMVENAPATFTSVPTQEAANVAAGIDGRDFISATESANTFMENGYTPLNPVEHTSVLTQEAANVAAGIDGRDFINATESANTFMENGYTPLNPVEHTSVPTQEAANVAAGIDGRDFISATESANVFMENGYTPLNPVEHTSVPTQEAADIAAGIDGRDFISATESARAFEELGLTDYEKDLIAQENQQTAPVAEVETPVMEMTPSPVAGGENNGRPISNSSSSIKTEDLGGIFTPVFMSGGSTPSTRDDAIASSTSTPVDEPTLVVESVPVETPSTPSVQISSIPTQEAADIAAGIDGRDFISATESANTFMENGYTPLNPVEHTSVPTQEAADIAAGIDGRDFISATESANTFMENGYAPLNPVEHTSVPTQEAADIAAGIDGRTFKDATESASAFIENDNQNEKDGVVIAPTPVKLNSIPDEYMVDTPVEKGNILLEKIRNGEIDREEWMNIYENEMKKAQAAKLAAVVAAAAAKKEAEEKDPSLITPVAPVAGGTNGIDRTEEDKERLTPVVVFKKAKDSLVQKLKNKKAIATLAATLAIIIALAHSCSAPNNSIAVEDTLEPPAISIDIDKEQEKTPATVVQTQTPVQQETKKEEATITQTPVVDKEEEKTQDQTPEKTPEQPDSTPEIKQDPVTPTTPVTPTPTPETPAQPLPEEKVEGFEIVNEEEDDLVKLRTQEQYNDLAGSTVRLDEIGEEIKQLSGEFMEITTESGEVIRTDSTGQTFLNGEYAGSVGTEEQVTLPDNTVANVVNVPEDVVEVPVEEVETPVAFVVENQTDYEMVNPDSFQAAQAAVAAGFLDQNPSDLTPDQVAQAYVDYMANNPTDTVEQSQGLGK